MRSVRQRTQWVGYRTESLVWPPLCSYVRPAFTCRLVVIALCWPVYENTLSLLNTGRAVVYVRSSTERSIVMLKTFICEITL